MQPPASGHSKSLRSAIVVALAALTGYAVVFLWAGVPEIIEVAGRIDGRIWALILCLTLTNHVIRFLRSLWLLRCLGHGQSARQLMTCYLYGVAFVATPARAGEAVRTYFMRKDGIPYTDSATILLLERIFDVLAMACLSLFAAAYVDTKATVVTVALIAVALVLSTRLDRLLDLFTAVVRRFSTGAKLLVLARFEAVRPVVSTLLKPPRPMICFASGLSGFIIQGAGLYFIISAIGYDAPFWASIGIYAFSVTVGSFTMLPGGVGGTEATMALLLTLIGVPASDTLVIIVVSRLSTLWFTVALGLLSLLLTRPPGFLAATGPPDNVPDR